MIRHLQYTNFEQQARNCECVVLRCSTHIGLKFELESLPPVLLSAKLVARILRGDFVDIVELLHDNLEVQRWGVIQESSTISSDIKRGQREIQDLLSWVQCFGTYMAVITSTQPTKSKELLAYQTLERPGGVVVGAGWHMFRQQAAGNPEGIGRS